MNWQSILKQGQCYTLAYDWMVDNMNVKAKLIHADVIGIGGDVKGKTYGHAFILLEDNKVLDVCTGVTMDKDTYYSIGQVNNVKEYTAREAAIEGIESGHRGPWD